MTGVTNNAGRTGGGGVFGNSNALQGTGVFGRNTGRGGNGVFGSTSADGGNGMYAENTFNGSYVRLASSVGIDTLAVQIVGGNAAGGAYATSSRGDGFHGHSAGSAQSAGVRGVSVVTNGNGGIFEANAGAAAYGIWGRSSSGYAGYFSGNVFVAGTLGKQAGSFKIDHPLDPENKFLTHSFVESPDMKNVYDGVATCDTSGRAVVALPDYFEALNRDYRYQLTCIGGFAPVFVEHEIRANQFTIAGGREGLRVSWQVTGIRQDAYANKHRLPVEEWKARENRGKYLSPDSFGAPATKGIVKLLPGRPLSDDRP